MCEKILNLHFFKHVDEDQIKILLKRLAEYVKNYAGDILNGNLEILKKVEILQKKKSDEYIKEMHLRPIREMADVAWRQKDYVKFVGLYSPVEDDLTPVEARSSSMLEKALRQLNQAYFL